MPVIAMTQEMGSLAKDVATRLTEVLGLSIVRHEVMDHVAEKMHVSKSLVNRLREGKAGLVERLKADQRSIALYTAEELYELASRGNVVLRGWGATVLLRPVPHVLCVRVTRPFDKRVDWLMQHLGTEDRESAADEVRRSDHAHAARMHQFYNVTWGDPLLYDLVLNTDRLSIETCVDIIRETVQRPEFAQTEASTALLRNLALTARVQAVLRDHAETKDINITIESNDGVVTLRGIVLNDQERKVTEQVVGAVAGVTGVKDELRLMATSRLFTSAKY